ncbi:hypothetical protein [Erythrobacter sp. WG]|uniref:hypothetical protein n=1 Tax=Erythrobacter sp. WG TaxID=2985510 RepID=UPI00226F22DB|nr:hypothetical protein [Erythrobacter sp. WG]MCX9146115.1 hypothetical protein [Erythrobacter sp. WG]
MITSRRSLVLALAPVALAACGSEPAQPGNDAESFAARIGAGGEATPSAGVGAPTAAATVAPKVAAPLPGAAPGAFARGTLTDPAAAKCGAPLMGPFLGKPADQATRAAIAKTLGRTDNLRFVAFGGDGFVNPDPTNPRLSIMLDAQNIIRDARCG